MAKETAWNGRYSFEFPVAIRWLVVVVADGARLQRSFQTGHTAYPQLHSEQLYPTAELHLLFQMLFVHVLIVFKLFRWQ